MSAKWEKKRYSDSAFVLCQATGHLSVYPAESLYLIKAGFCVQEAELTRST